MGKHVDITTKIAEKEAQIEQLRKLAELQKENGGEISLSPVRTANQINKYFRQIREAQAGIEQETAQFSNVCNALGREKIKVKSVNELEPEAAEVFSSAGVEVEWEHAPRANKDNG